MGRIQIGLLTLSLQYTGGSWGGRVAKMSARHRMSSTNKLIIKTCKNVKMLLYLFYSTQEMLVFLWNLASMLYFNGNQSVLRFVGFRCQAIHTDLMFSHINDHRPKLLVFCQNGLCFGKMIFPYVQLSILIPLKPRNLHNNLYSIVL